MYISLFVENYHYNAYNLFSKQIIVTKLLYITLFFPLPYSEKVDKQLQSSKDMLWREVTNMKIYCPTISTKVWYSDNSGFENLSYFFGSEPCTIWL